LAQAAGSVLPALPSPRERLCASGALGEDDGYA